MSQRTLGHGHAQVCGYVALHIYIYIYTYMYAVWKSRGFQAYAVHVEVPGKLSWNSRMCSNPQGDVYFRVASKDSCSQALNRAATEEVLKD